jgi:hypothetical protein
MEESSIQIKRPAILLSKEGFRLEEVSTGHVVLRREEVIDILKTLEGMKRKLQLLLK